MPASEDLLTPIHKGVRSMIYAVGARLQSTDFTDPAETDLVLEQLNHDFATAPAVACVLCLLHQHGGDEETGLFPEARRFTRELVDALVQEHHEVTRRFEGIAKTSAEIHGARSPEERIALGARLNREANALFAFYIAHMNREEELLVPATQQHFTDEQLRAIRGGVMGRMPPERLAKFMTWVLPALNANELTAMYTGLRRGAPPELVRRLTEIAEHHVDPARWARVRARSDAALASSARP